MSTTTDRELLGLLRDLRTAPRNIQTGTRRVMREAGASVLQDASQKAAWSTRIPDALRMRVTLAGDRPGVELRVDRRAAPHGRVLEGFRGLRFRHPVFEQNDRPVVWVEQSARPYLVPAVAAAGPRLQREIAAAASDALSKSHL